MKYIIKTKKSNAYPTLESARKAAESLCKSTGKIVEVYARESTCHPPEPQPCRWEDANGVEEHICDFHRAMDGTCMVCGKGESVKQSDRDYDRVPLGDLPAPPDGFAFYGVGPLDVFADDYTTDIRGYYDFSWDHENNKGCGTGHHPYALRIGSDIAKRNGIGGGNEQDT